MLEKDTEHLLLKLCWAAQKFARLAQHRTCHRNGPSFSENNIQNKKGMARCMNRARTSNQ